MGWIQRQIEEIERDRALQLFGLALALANVLTFAFWRFTLPVVEILAPDAIPICWPFFNDCHLVRGLSESALSGLLWGYLAASLAAVLAFASPRFAWLGYWILFALLFYRGFFLFQDYRLRLNQHYMLYWSMFAFLFVSGKRVAIRYLVVLFYFWAGIIKLNPEWISGAALYGESLLLIPDSLISAACIYVVVLELLLIFGLLSRRALLFWATLAQLAMFHLISWSIVGFYYPLLMACILSIFLLERHIRPPPQPELPGAPSLARGRRVALGVLLGGFFSIQFLPYAYPGDSAITGEGRFFALHMFDAPIECQAVALKTTKDGQQALAPLQAHNLSERVHCDPIVFWSMARHICRSNRANPDFVDIGVLVRTRRVGKTDWQRVIEIDHFCETNPEYRALGHNDWILIDSEPQ
jgi:hypothetical protein